ncbi:MAG TPA: YcxB family protein, partial [Tepidisphaeraceae bacterium]|nr:YcxB family protein [Tepidisphaeraceae bacterium]
RNAEFSNPDLAAARRSKWFMILWGAGAVLLIPSTALLCSRHTLLWLIPCVMSLLWSGLVIYFMILKRTRWAGRRAFTADEHCADPVAVVIDEQGIHLLRHLYQFHVEWNAVTWFYQTPNLVLLIDNAPNIFMIPKRAFPSAESREEFCQRVRKFLLDARTPLTASY